MRPLPHARCVDAGASRLSEIVAERVPTSSRDQALRGVGLGLFWFTTPTSTVNSAVRPGLNVLAGTRVFVTKQMALFGEYKYNHTSFPGDGFKADYHAHFVVFGVGYHF